MREAEVAVEFRPSEKTVHVLQGTLLLEAAAGAGIVLDQPCGGAGVCGKCRVLVADGAGEPTAQQRDHFSEEELRAGWRLGCQTRVAGPMTVDVPQGSLLDSQHKILARTDQTQRPLGEAPVCKRYVEMPPPARGDDQPDLLRLQRAIGPSQIGLDLLRSMPGRLRDGGFCGTAVLADGHLIDFEPGNATEECFAVALDVGTTTLAGILLDVATARQRAVTSRLNPQTRFGDDVLSRILHARQGPDALDELREAICAALDAMIGELVDQAGIRRERVYALTFAGNTTMQQLLCGVDPGSLGEIPFVPTMGHSLTLPAGELDLHIHPRGRAYVLPVIGGFVGGDTVSGILATGLADTQEPTLLIDIGTNGEIVLATGGQLLAASTAAGPAFEGARISHGMRGTGGAIEKVVVDGRLRVNVIGDVPPIGLCGSALIDAAAELLRHGLMTSQGRLTTAEEAADDLPGELAKHLVTHDEKPAFVLAPESETGHGRPVLLTQRDLRELQLATGAIRAGICILLRRAELRPSDLHEVWIGGGFGNFIRRSNAQRIGLIPAEVPHHRIRFLGNTSLAGARLTALSQQAREMAEELARRTQHVDLSCDADFQMAFAEAMIFPEDDAT